jgi:hypothetical protein
MNKKLYRTYLICMGVPGFIGGILGKGNPLHASLWSIGLGSLGSVVTVIFLIIHMVGSNEKNKR